MRNNQFLLKEETINQLTKIICFPFAGGGGSKYLKWSSYFKNQAEVVPIQLPGRENRIGERKIECFDEAVEKISLEIYHCYKDIPFAFWGHSMGGLLAICSAIYLDKNFSISPLTCFLSGCFPNFQNKGENLLPSRSDQELLDMLITIGGIDDELITHPEIINFFLPIVKSDYRLIETFHLPNDKVSCPIKTYSGMNDLISPTNKVVFWKDYTDCYLGNTEYEGNHFFNFANEENICKDIMNIINKTIFCHPE